MLDTWRAYEPSRTSVAVPARTSVWAWLLGGTGLALVAGLSASGWRQALGMLAGAAGVAVGTLLAVLWRQVGQAFPRLAVHATLILAGAAPLVIAGHLARQAEATAVLSLVVVPAALWATWTPVRWSMPMLLLLCTGVDVVVVTAPLQRGGVVAPVMDVLLLAAGTWAGTSAARVHGLTLTDPTTGLPNLAAFELVMERQAALSRRLHRPLALVVVDVGDLLDREAPSGSRAAVDALLRGLGDRWSADLRGADVLAHLDGGEFLLVLPDCGPPATATVVRRLLEVAGGWGKAGATGFLAADTFGSALDRARRSSTQAAWLASDEMVVRSADGDVASTLADLAGDPGAVTPPAPPAG